MIATATKEITAIDPHRNELAEARAEIRRLKSELANSRLMPILPERVEPVDCPGEIEADVAAFAAKHAVHEYEPVGYEHGVPITPGHDSWTCEECEIIATLSVGSIPNEIDCDNLVAYVQSVCEVCQPNWANGRMPMALRIVYAYTE